MNGPERPGGRAPRARPSRLWLFFHGRKRRGFPGLVVGGLALVFALALLFRLPGGPDFSRYATAVSVAALLLLILCSLALVLAAFFRPPRGRR